MSSSRPSSTCRIEWRPSRLRQAALLVVAGLAVAALQWSGLPRPAALAGAFAVVAYAGTSLRRDARRPHGVLAWRGETCEWHGPGGIERLATVNLRWRGPLATLSARDEAGKLRRLSWWPDTLPPPARRALRLAAGRGDARRVDAPP
jgi:toxin CptA